jgi:hypothetical protein
MQSEKKINNKHKILNARDARIARVMNIATQFSF